MEDHKKGETVEFDEDLSKGKNDVAITTLILISKTCFYKKESIPTKRKFTLFPST
jgi:hypothetical protein